MRYRRKVTEVEAIQFKMPKRRPQTPGRDTRKKFRMVSWTDFGSTQQHPYVTTAQGDRIALNDGDWILPELNGHNHYPCKPDIFEATYEPVDN